MTSVCLSVRRLASVAYIRPAGWPAGMARIGCFWLIGPGSAGLAQSCRCALPLQGARAYCGSLPHSLFTYFALFQGSGNDIFTRHCYVCNMPFNRDRTHGSRFTICGDACPISCVNAEACLRLAQCMSPLRRDGKLVNAALLSLINEACANVC